MTALRLSARIERWPINGGFTIARGTKTHAVTVTAAITDGAVTGHGECTPYARYGETPDGVLQAILAMEPALQARDPREHIKENLAAGAARNAVDCALWDYEAKRTGRSIFQLTGLAPASVITAYTISLGKPEQMARAARAAAGRFPLLKVKLGGGHEDRARMMAVRKASPDARLIADANESWKPELFTELMAVADRAGFELVEQPLPAEQDALLEHCARPVPVCADESVFCSQDVTRLRNRYDAINIKLDKTGGLTEALQTVKAAQAAGLKIMIGCMVATSLAMAPAMALAAQAHWVDLDGPLLLENDRTPGLRYYGGWVSPPCTGLWG